MMLDTNTCTQLKRALIVTNSEGLFLARFSNVYHLEREGNVFTGACNSVYSGCVGHLW